jgi:hypothetical protein
MFHILQLKQSSSLIFTPHTPLQHLTLSSHRRLEGTECLHLENFYHPIQDKTIVSKIWKDSFLLVLMPSGVFSRNYCNDGDLGLGLTNEILIAQFLIPSSFRICLKFYIFVDFNS